MINGKKHVIGAIVISLLALSLAGCQKEGPAEKAGKKVDNAIGSAEQKIDNAMK